jgi:hypothetical protein
MATVLVFEEGVLLLRVLMRLYIYMNYVVLVVIALRSFETVFKFLLKVYLFENILN